jgi:hypothetical protein
LHEKMGQFWKSFKVRIHPQGIKKDRHIIEWQQLRILFNGDIKLSFTYQFGQL